MEGYKEISLSKTGPAEALTRFPSPEYVHAAHLMLYARQPGELFGKYHYNAVAMMQLRFDGMLGFPGGIVDKGETPQQAVMREFVEEVGCEPGLVTVTKDDHICSHHSEHTKLCLHFFAKEVSYDLYGSLEKAPLSAKDWGNEVFGIIRIPLYTLPNGLGLPGFLKNAFIGNSLVQLGLALTRRQILTEEQWTEALKTSNRVSGLVTQEEIDY